MGTDSRRLRLLIVRRSVAAEALHFIEKLEWLPRACVLLK
jgi:hypothetical protein